MSQPKKSAMWANLRSQVSARIVSDSEAIARETDPERRAILQRIINDDVWREAQFHDFSTYHLAKEAARGNPVKIAA
jgi:hypothetical protein